MNIQTRTEGSRGCGYRKGGAMYLVQGAFIAIQCGKLPLPLKTCPACGGGVKQTRGFTWINPAMLFRDVPCANAASTDHQLCPLAMPEDKAGLLWIGEKFYRSPREFVNEGVKQGISRRISQIPRDFVVGEHRVYVAHPKAVKCTECQGEPDADVGCEHCNNKGYFPGIFSSFQPDAIEYVVKGDETDEELEKLEARGLTLVKIQRVNDDGNTVDEDGGRIKKPWYKGGGFE